MSIKISIAIAATIVLATASMASAANKHGKTTRRALNDRATVSRVPLGADSDSPAATGGGSIGYNRNIYNW